MHAQFHSFRVTSVQSRSKKSTPWRHRSGRFMMNWNLRLVGGLAGYSALESAAMHPQEAF